MSDQTKADELRVVATQQGDVTVWAVDVYYGQQRMRRVGTATNKWHAVVIALDMATTLDVDEVNVTGRF